MKTLVIIFLFFLVFWLAQSSNDARVKGVADQVSSAAQSGFQAAVLGVQNWANDGKASPANAGDNGRQATPTDAQRNAWIKAQHRKTHAKDGVKDCEYCRGL